MGIDIVVQLANKPASLPEARAALSPLEAAVDPDTFETLRLLVTELVANSIRHSAQPRGEDIELAVRASRQKIRVEVTDAGAGFNPLPRAEGADEASGWGLHLIETLSDRWGTERTKRMCVWFELVDSGAFRLARDRSSPGAETALPEESVPGFPGEGG